MVQAPCVRENAHARASRDCRGTGVSLRLLRAFARAPRWAAILAAISIFTASANGQISPGPLSKAHQSLSGPTQCASCHKLGTGSAEFKCLDCHKEIARRLDEKRGLHATLVTNRSNPNCAGCHSEHNGEDFSLIHWEPTPQRFDHTKTGYVLEGKHSGLECAKCHLPEHIAEAERPSILVKDLHRTFLGLGRDCLVCHRDVHRGELGSDCQRCHTSAGWKLSSPFDHSRTRFPLTGKHVAVACQKCHPSSGPGQAPQFKGIRFDTCTACHTDVHRGAFADSCQTCHTTSGWKQVALAGKFDHAKTNYPLLGKHSAVACNGCHLAGNFKKPVAHQKCADCHSPDPHGGQFRDRADGGDCAACHTVDGFKPASFGLSEHAKTRYPLAGRHASVECAKCHLPRGKATQYRIKFAQCLDCHTDQHRGQFAAAPLLNRCESCHTVQGYRPSTFTLARHQQTRFPLDGGHVAVACGECHRADPLARGPASVPYHFENLACAACHTDPHSGQFRDRMGKLRANGSASSCEACHSTKSWRELSRFDHASTAFPLVGAHRAVPCAECHRPANLETSLRNVKFSSAPSQCQNCHDDPHARQFSTAGKSPVCTDCHDTAKWKPSLFDHDKRTRFPLTGGHKGVKCSACHTLVRSIEGKTVLFYKPTPRDCAACHGDA